MKLKPSFNVGRVNSRAPSFGIPAPSGVQAVRPGFRGGYQLIECMVYIAVLFTLLSAAYLAFYRFMDNSLALRRSTDDIAKALHAGECWRADLRAATRDIRQEDNADGAVVVIPGTHGGVAYQTTTNAVLRRVGSGAWTPLLERVKLSTMASDPRPNVTAWRWELELQPRSRKPVRVRPLFTFIAVPEQHSLP